MNSSKFRSSAIFASGIGSLALAGILFFFSGSNTANMLGGGLVILSLYLIKLSRSTGDLGNLKQAQQKNTIAFYSLHTSIIIASCLGAATVISAGLLLATQAPFWMYALAYCGCSFAVFIGYAIFRPR